jgi:O-antigen ligase
MGSVKARERTALLVLLAAAVVVPTISLGGYTTSSRLLFAGLAGTLLLGAFLSDEDRVRRFVRAGPVAALAALAALSLVSATWSIDPTASSRWGLVIAGYACVAVGSAVFASDRRAVVLLAALVAVTAALAAALGLFGLAVHEGPFAEKIYGRWRPGGPFEYPPTLALVQVSALPAFLYGMAKLRPGISLAAAIGGVLATGTIALSGSRLQLVLGLIVLLAAATLRDRATTAKRPMWVAATAALAAGGVAMYAASRLSSGGLERLAAFVLVCVTVAAGWWLTRRRLARVTRTTAPRSVALAAGLAAVVLAGASIVELTTRLDGGDVAHGRVDEWRDAAATAGRRPVVGHGADTYVAASARERRSARARYAHNLPLETAAEVGVLGLMLVLALYALVLRAAWLARGTLAGALLAPAAVAFLVTNLVDWPWHHAAAGSLWALAVGGIVAAVGARGRP